ncbi:MAG: hypothetical protein WC593_09190 [Methanoregula sp.]
MRLPRGTFLTIKKSEPISSIIDEFVGTKFSGICDFSSGLVNGTLVFRSGTCILARILDTSGDEAWDELQKMSHQEADAALSSLDETQVQLALEFNEECRIIKAVITAPSAATPPLPDPLQEPKNPAELKDTPPETSSFEKDIDTFNMLDIDDVTEKIRNDCKTMIKQLHLEHLMER